MFCRCLITFHASVYLAGGGTFKILWLIFLGLFFLLLTFKVCLCIYVGVHVCADVCMCRHVGVQACVCRHLCVQVHVWCVYSCGFVGVLCGEQKLALGVPLTRSSPCFSPCSCVCVYGVSADVWAQLCTGACVCAHVSRGLKLRSGVFLNSSLSYLLMARSPLNSELAVWPA